jgi:hypothetical protein
VSRFWPESQRAKVLSDVHDPLSAQGPAGEMPHCFSDLAHLTAAVDHRPNVDSPTRLSAGLACVFLRFGVQ